MSDECIILEVTVKKRFDRQQGLESEPKEQPLLTATYRIKGSWNTTETELETELDKRIKSVFLEAVREK